MRARRTAVLATAATMVMAALAGAAPAHAAAPQVLLVGTFHGIAGQFTSIQAAVDAAAPGDWVLVAPGDYHEQGHPTDLTHVAGVLVTKPGIHLRGMDRNAVVVDGTLPTAPSGPQGFGCDSAPSSQQRTPVDSSGTYVGRNGIEVFKADGVSIENLTVCNYLSNAGGGNGNQVWWNGGDGSGTIGMGPLSGAYLTASSSYNYGADPANHGSNNVPMGKYGIFTSNERGPGVIAHTYASNMGDSDYYIGACADCNIDLTDPHAEYSSLGFSGTNAGGHLIIENGEWDNNKTGLAPNALNNDDWPSPPDGVCPGGTGSCSIIRNNNIHDNNNVNAPAFGIAGSAPPGTGIILSGVRNYTITGNTVANNSSWGVVLNDFPDTETPPADAVAAGKACNGGIDLSTPLTPLCDYPAFGNEVAHNTFTSNGGNANPGNGDIAVAAAPHNPGNCFHDNTDTSGSLSSDPPLIQTVMGTCGLPNGWFGPSLVSLVCGTPGAVSVGPVTPSCPPPLGPITTTVSMGAIPHHEKTMPHPCDGVPANPWCTSGGVAGAQSHGPRQLVAESVGATLLPNTSAAARGATGATAATVAALLGIPAVARRRRRRAEG